MAPSLKACYLRYRQTLINCTNKYTLINYDKCYKGKGQGVMRVLSRRGLIWSKGQRGFSKAVTFNLRNEGQVAVYQLTGIRGRESIPSRAHSWHYIHEVRSNLRQPCPSISHSTFLTL